MFAQRCARRLVRLGVRRATVSPVLNEQAAAVFPAILPFGFDSVDPKLKAALVAKGVDVDAFERLHIEGLCNDQEFESAALPRRDSPLWGYIYGEELVKCAVRLETLDSSEEFLRNFLTAKVTELTERMKRYYPDLDWKSQFEAQLRQVREPVDEAREAAHNEVLASIIARSPEAHVAYHRKNAFFEFDEDDTFKDHLPRDCEAKLLARLRVAWALNASQCSDEVFGRLQEIEKAVTLPIDALAKPLRTNLNEFLVNCLETNVDLVRDFVEAIKSASTVTTCAEANAKQLVQESLEALQVGNPISVPWSAILAKAFFGNSLAATQLEGRDATDVADLLASLDEERLRLVREATELSKYAKHHSLGRLAFGVLLHNAPSFFGQFLSDDAVLRAFVADNEAPLSDLVESQRQALALHDEFAASLEAFVQSLSPQKFDGMDNAVRNALLTAADSGERNCPLIATLESSAAVYREKGDLFKELKTQSLATYLRNCGDGVYYYRLLEALTAPDRNGIRGCKLQALANAFATNASEASGVIYDSAVDFVRGVGGVSGSEASALKASLTSDASESFDQLKAVSDKYNSALNAVVDAVLRLRYDYEGEFCFDRVRDAYAPLDIHLAQHEYFN